MAAIKVRQAGRVQISTDPPLRIEQLLSLMETAASERERKHWLVLWLMGGLPDGCDTEKSLTTSTVARITDYSPTRVRSIVKDYNRLGPRVVRTRTRRAPPANLLPRGRKPILTKPQQERLRKALQEAKDVGTTWTSKQVRDWIKKKTGRSVNLATAWRYREALVPTAGSKKAGIMVDANGSQEVLSPEEFFEKYMPPLFAPTCLAVWESVKPKTRGRPKQRDQ